MSVAFRRETDDEHKEPKFERPIPPGPNLVTSRGLKLIEAEVARLEAEPDAALDEAAAADRARDLRYWRTRLATARIAPPPPEDEAGFGSRVAIRLEGRARTIDIVGDDEADPAADRLAFSAPLARALIGAGEGDRVAFGRRTVEVVGVGVIPDEAGGGREGGDQSSVRPA